MRGGWIWMAAIAVSVRRVSGAKMGSAPPPGGIKAGDEPVERGIVNARNPQPQMAKFAGEILLSLHFGHSA